MWWYFLNFSILYFFIYYLSLISSAKVISWFEGFPWKEATSFDFLCNFIPIFFFHSKTMLLSSIKLTACMHNKIILTMTCYNIKIWSFFFCSWIISIVFFSFLNVLKYIKNYFNIIEKNKLKMYLICKKLPKAGNSCSFFLSLSLHHFKYLRWMWTHKIACFKIVIC